MIHGYTPLLGSPHFDAVSCAVLLGIIAVIIIYRLTRGG